MADKSKASSEEKDTNSFAQSFKQQVMKAWQPVPTINSTIILFGLLSVFFLMFGIILIVYTSEIIEYEERYDVKCQDKLVEDFVINSPTQSITAASLCTIDIKIDEKITGPIFVYYELDNFYQNHRRYVKSRDVYQLKGDNVSKNNLDDCSPIKTNEDANVKFSYTGTPLEDDEKAIPCGLIAKSFFTDEFFFTEKGKGFDDSTYPITQKGIAWPSDRKHKFKNPKDSETTAWIDLDKNERFIVWMRTAALPFFRKLWGKINKDVEKGDYTFHIYNNYKVSDFDGKKYIVISTANAFGGKNNFLAIAYIVVGCMCLVITIGFIVKKILIQKNNKKD